MTLFSKIGIGALAIGLSACSMTTIAPIEQLQDSLNQRKPVSASAKAGRDTVKQLPIIKYYCDKKKVVRIQPISKKKNSVLKVFFNQTSYELSPTVSDKGKKYSNIRWIWLEDFKGRAMLIDNRHKILANNCVKKK